jgi:hypothetical protein
MRKAIRALITGFMTAAVIPALVFAQSTTPAPANTGASAPAAQSTSAPVTQPAGTPSAPAASGAQSAAPAGAAIAATAKTETGLILPAGSSLHVRLGTTLTSKTNKSGDKFRGFVDEPLMVNGKTIVPKGSIVDGHVVFVKKSGRVSGVGQMRIVLDDITTEDGNKFDMNASLDEAQGSPCARTSGQEGTIKGCGKSKKDALKGAGIGAAMGAGAGATVGMGHEIDCQYFGNCGGPSFGGDVLYGAAVGAGATLIYNVLRHEKPLILIEGTELTFTVNRSVRAQQETPVNLNPGLDTNNSTSSD